MRAGGALEANTPERHDQVCTPRGPLSLPPFLPLTPDMPIPEPKKQPEP
jgi:hypothetical protein